MSEEQQREQQLVKLYMDLTGTNESSARCVCMYVPPLERNSTTRPKTAEDSMSNRSASNPFSSSPLKNFVLVIALLWVGQGFAWAGETVATNSFFSKPLSLVDAINIALEQNADVLRAQKDFEATQGIIIQTRAIAIPKLRLVGGYNALAPGDVDSLVLPGLTGPTGFALGTEQSWNSQIKLVQSLYEGGRILSAFRVAKLLREQSLLNYQTALANTVLDVQVSYYDVLLAAQQVTVQEASVELLSGVLSDTTKRFDAGTVPRFNVLRAEVELANARPKLIRAKNSLKITKNNLANILGYNLPKETQEDIPLTLSGELKAEPYQMELSTAISTALENRTELGALRKAQGLRKEDIVSAKAGYKPSIQAFGGYDARSSIFSTDLTREVHGWITGVQLTWDIFDGLRTQGKIKETRANYERAGVDLDDAGRRIEKEVRTAYSNFKDADEVLQSQIKVLEQADEALRLARARNEAGTGTQLDVLSAQTALTEARTTQSLALRDYAVARSRLERAIGLNVPSVKTQP